jgi:hypothetical protein
VQGRVGRVRFWRSVSSFNYVQVTKGGEEGLGWVVEKKFGSETADCDISAADGVKEGGVGRGAKGAGDIGGEGSIVDTEGRDTWDGCGGVWGYIGWLWGWWWGYVESPHVLACSFRANENGCRVSRGIDR